MAPTLLAVGLLVVHLLGAHAELLSSRPGSVHTLILTDCHEYQDWQTIAAAYAWRDSGQPGSVTRVANCDDKDAKNYNKDMLEYVHTHMAPQFSWNAELKDWYAAYNKPGAVVDWLKHVDPKEDWVVVLDSDMLLRRHFTQESLPKLDRGWAFAAHYDYLKGVDNELALRHVKDVAPRNDTLAGPAGRRGDRVGGPYYMHREDLKKVAPLWLNYTKIMRNDMEAWKDSGDTAAKEGDRIWIAEMYGYSFGAARANVWHMFSHDFMLYPGYTPTTMPRVIHYGLIYDVPYNGGTWQYDKHWYFDFDAHKCTPWDLKQQRPKHGIFPPPPHPSKLKHKDYLDYYKDLIAIQTIALVNAGLCDYHVRYCPPSQQLKEVCEEVFALYDDIKFEIQGVERQWHCVDHVNECQKWSERGECKTSEQYMREHCRAACKFCTPEVLPALTHPPHRKVASGPSDPDSAAAAAATKAAGDGSAVAAWVASLHGSGGIAAAAKPVEPAAAAAAAHEEQLKKEAEEKAKATAEAKQQQQDVAAKKQQEKLAADQAKQQQAAMEKHQAAKDAAVQQQAAAGTAQVQQQEQQQQPAGAGDTAKPKLDAAAGAVGAAAGGSAGAAAAGGGAGVAAAGGGAAAAAGGALPTEAELRAKYSASTMKYNELVQRCTQLQGLAPVQVKECIHAASFRLLYPGTLKPGAAAVAKGATLLTDSQKAATGSSAAADGDAVLPSHTGGTAHDLAGLGEHHSEGTIILNGNRFRQGHSRELLLVASIVLLAVGLTYYRSLQGKRLLLRKVQHRAE